MLRSEKLIRISRGFDPASRSGRAITLIELVIAADVVIVLILCVAATTGNVRARSKNSVCLNNLSRIGYANLIYAANDPSDPALPVHGAQFLQDIDNPTWIGAYEWGGKSGIGDPGWVPGAGGAEFFLTSRFGTKAGFGPASRPLNEILYGGGFEDHLNPVFDPDGAVADTQLDLFLNRCPSDNGYTGIHKPAFRDERHTSFDHYGTSYCASLFMTSWVGGGPVWSNSPYMHRLSDVVAPASTLAYMENNGRFAWAADPPPSACASLLGDGGVPGIVHGWHGKDWTFNAAFLDGHAVAIHMRGFHSPKVLIDENEQAYSTCIIIRGEDWQLDTLPLPNTPLGLVWRGGGRVSWEGGIE